MAQSDDNPKLSVAVMRLTPRVAASRIQRIAQITDNVKFSRHARERMIEREFLDIDVLRVLRKGYVDGWPEVTEKNEWKCKMVLKTGGRTAGVITIILRSEKLFVKSVEWEDML